MNLETIWSGDIHAPHRGLLTVPPHPVRSAPEVTAPRLPAPEPHHGAPRYRQVSRAQVLDALDAAHWRTTGDLAEQLDASPCRVACHLAALWQEGRVLRQGGLPLGTRGQIPYWWRKRR